MREAYPMSTLTLDSFTFSYPSDTSHWGAWEPRPLASTTRSAASSSSLDSPWRCRRCHPRGELHVGRAQQAGPGRVLSEGTHLCSTRHGCAVPEESLCVPPHLLQADRAQRS